MFEKCQKPPSAGLVEMTASGNFQPFNASGNIHQIAILKRLLNTLSRHFRAQYEELKTTKLVNLRTTLDQSEFAHTGHSRNNFMCYDLFSNTV
jgi:hypothetical protein